MTPGRTGQRQAMAAGRAPVSGDETGADTPERRQRSTPRTDDRQDREAGFTLLEILVVVAILGLLVGLVAPAALRQFGGAQVSITRQSIERIGGALDIYRLDTGAYPNTEQGLQALVTPPSGVATWSGPYLKADQGSLLDPWGRAYLYRSPSARAGRDYDLCSRGPNAQPGAAAAQEGMICN